MAEVVVPALRRVVERSDETASFYVRDGDERVCLHRAEPNRIVRVSAHEGDRFPLERGASGKVILAFNGATGKGMDDIRRSLCAMSVGERDPETAAVACAVFGQQDLFVGALNISGPRVRLTERKQREFKTVLLTEAKALSAALGADKRRFEQSDPAASARRS
jgi:DNA-binding IclR family transcriptional regulator